MGREYCCWMLKSWCITWPVGFKRLNEKQINKIRAFTGNVCSVITVKFNWFLITFRNVLTPSPMQSMNLLEALIDRRQSFFLWRRKVISSYRSANTCHLGYKTNHWMLQGENVTFFLRYSKDLCKHCEQNVEMARWNWQ